MRRIPLGASSLVCFSNSGGSSTDNRRTAWPTGLDYGARLVLVRLFTDACVSADDLVERFLRDSHYADVAEYLRTMEAKGDPEPARGIRLAVSPGRTLRVGATSNLLPGWQHSVLTWMPEADFLTMIEMGIPSAGRIVDQGMLPMRINEVCRGRGIPYRMDGLGRSARFRWIGDAVVLQQALRPALSALDDPRLANGPKQEFDAARDELRKGTPAARKRAIAEACNSVESV